MYGIHCVSVYGTHCVSVYGIHCVSVYGIHCVSVYGMHSVYGYSIHCVSTGNASVCVYRCRRVVCVFWVCVCACVHVHVCTSACVLKNLTKWGVGCRTYITLGRV